MRLYVQRLAGSRRRKGSCHLVSERDLEPLDEYVVDYTIQVNGTAPFCNVELSSARFYAGQSERQGRCVSGLSERKGGALFKKGTG